MKTKITTRMPEVSVTERPGTARAAENEPTVNLHPRTRSMDLEFCCEEGESHNPIPMPGLIQARRRTTHWRADVGYTNAEKRASATFEIDRRSVDQGWTEEDGSAVQLPGLLVSSRSGMASEDDLLGVERAEPVKGLCASCEHQKRCTFPKSESGVWRCEEYR